MDGTWHLDKHRIRLEGDVLFCKYVGVITLSDVKEQMQILDQQFEPGKTYYIIADVSEVSGMDAEARKLSTDWFAHHDIGGTVNFGSGLATRAISALILSLLRLLYKNSMPTHFVKTEEEARAWVDAQRRRRAEARTPR